MTYIIISFILAIISLGLLNFMAKIHINFNKRVLVALTLGSTIGFLIQYFYPILSINSSMPIFDTISNIYIRLLQMLIFPVIIISILSAMTKIGESNNILKSLSGIIGILLFTTAISAIVGIIITLNFNIDLSILQNITLPVGFENKIAERTSILNKSASTFITDFITTNPFLDLTGARPNSIASIVIFLLFVGFAYLGIKRKEPAIADKFKSGIEVLYKLIMRMVVLVLRLTPYGIFALFVKITAITNLIQLLSLIKFIGISYIAIIIMFIIHSLMLMMFGFNILTYYKKAFSVLLFAFSSRSSASAIPLNINTQIKALGVSQSNASASASFGAILGQNGCAGIYPAMLAVCVAPLVGINPLDLGFLSMLVLLIVINSFGIAGVGGGATFAAIATLSAFNMPLGIIALLIGVEPLIDMARTALNVNGSIVSSLISSKLTSEIDMDTFNNKEVLANLDSEI